MFQTIYQMADGSLTHGAKYESELVARKAAQVLVGLSLGLEQRRCVVAFVRELPDSDPVRVASVMDA